MSRPSTRYSLRPSPLTLLVLGVLALLLTWGGVETRLEAARAFQSQSPAPTNTPVPTSTAIPTDTPVVAVTQAPTSTPTPIPTATPVPTAGPADDEEDEPTPTEEPFPTEEPPLFEPTPENTPTPVPPTIAATETPAPQITPAPMPESTATLPPGATAPVAQIAVPAAPDTSQTPVTDPERLVRLIDTLVLYGAYFTLGCGFIFLAILAVGFFFLHRRARRLAPPGDELPPTP